MSAEADWYVIRDQIREDIAALIAIGVPLDTARRLTNWSEVYEFEFFSEVSGIASAGNVPPVTFPRYPADRLWVSSSENRWSPVLLHQAVLDSTKLYAVYNEDAPDAGIIQIEYFLDAVSVHTEFSVPWDFNGTTGGGEANRYSFPAGYHTVTAEVTDVFGLWDVQATFEVQ